MEEHKNCTCPICQPLLWAMGIKGSGSSYPGCPEKGGLAICSKEEPVFILRAQDISAPALVQLWITLNPQISKEKLKSALETLEAMKNWQKKKKAD